MVVFTLFRFRTCINHAILNVKWRFGIEVLSFFLFDEDPAPFNPLTCRITVSGVGSGWEASSFPAHRRLDDTFNPYQSVHSSGYIGVLVSTFSAATFAEKFSADSNLLTTNSVKILSENEGYFKSESFKLHLFI